MRRLVDENGQHYVIRHGKRIAVMPVEIPETPKRRKRRKAFKPEWAKLPLRWAEILRQSKSAATLHLAHVILFEAFRRQHTGGEIVLSATVTHMPRSTRIRAMRELAELGLIEVRRSSGNQAYRVSVKSTT